ncbi:L-threonylcarbamoyladenylate synthase [Breoghania sp.]|uniref:L-threonylcarbamoyladenylate synthase n=1 Tax=Breoghania sp. TaxID=2065378 RepID=UPI002AABA585|nr:L-threonylcarbamoyladenylate synthase [Breoghania sp.]
MTIWRIDPYSAELSETEGLRHAVDTVAAGDLVAVPTETVYGLAADATNPLACAKIYAAKGRPSFNPLISHFADTASARIHAVFDKRAEALAEAFWPGPLTLVLPRCEGSAICDLVTAGLDSVAVRVPDSPVMQMLSQVTGRPLAAPSANRSGRISPTTAAAVEEDLGDAVPVILDAGPTRVGVESTIIALIDEEARLLRPGGIAREEAERVLGGPLSGPTGSRGDAPAAPGMLLSHYAPRARVRLNAMSIAPGEAYLGFGPVPEIIAKTTSPRLNLSETGDLAEAAAHLFSQLRALDASGAPSIAVAPIPNTGLGEALNDRLSRAAADRTGAGARSG